MIQSSIPIFLLLVFQFPDLRFSVVGSGEEFPQLLRYGDCGIPVGNDMVRAPQDVQCIPASV